MRKDDLNVKFFQNENWYSPKSNRWFFSNFDCRKTFPQEGFYVKKNFGGYGANFWKKTEVLHAERNKRAEAATSKSSAAGGFLQYIYWLMYLAT